METPSAVLFFPNGGSLSFTPGRGRILRAQSLSTEEPHETKGLDRNTEQHTEAQRLFSPGRIRNMKSLLILYILFLDLPTALLVSDIEE